MNKTVKGVKAETGTNPLGPTRLCLNNKRLNYWSKDGKAVVLDGPFSLNPSRQYYVNELSIDWKDKCTENMQVLKDVIIVGMHITGTHTYVF